MQAYHITNPTYRDEDGEQVLDVPGSDSQVTYRWNADQSQVVVIYKGIPDSRPPGTEITDADGFQAAIDAGIGFPSRPWEREAKRLGVATDVKLAEERVQADVARDAFRALQVDDVATVVGDVDQAVLKRAALAEAERDAAQAELNAAPAERDAVRL